MAIGSARRWQVKGVKSEWGMESAVASLYSPFPTHYSPSKVEVVQRGGVVVEDGTAHLFGLALHAALDVLFRRLGGIERGRVGEVGLEQHVLVADHVQQPLRRRRFEPEAGVDLALEVLAGQQVVLRMLLA